MQGELVGAGCFSFNRANDAILHSSINADGFGVAFYPSETDETTPMGPCIFRSITPA